MSEAETGSPASATSNDSKASPFGAARPIDTFAKEKEIEEKRQLALRQKKEHDDKVREEKRLAKESAKQEKVVGTADKKDKENAADASTPKIVEILSKAGTGDANGHEADEAAHGDEDARQDSANGNVVDDKAVKPREIVRDVPGSDTKKDESTADALEEDGWSTVQKPKGGRRGGGNPGSRAIAS